LSPMNENQLHQIRDERKEQIMGAALKVFARRGLAGTKMSMIAHEAGISHGLLYHYFKSKEELFVSLVEEAMEGAEAAMKGISEYPGTAIDKIKALTKEILDESGTPYFMLIHQARTSEGVPEKAKELIDRLTMEWFVEQLLPVFVAGQQAGEIIPGDPRELISTYLMVLSGLMTLDVEAYGYRMPNIELLLRLVAAAPPVSAREG